MLRRQQASAIIAARQQIVKGAVGMVDMALEELRNNQVVDLDEERKAAMVSNLLVVLCGEEDREARMARRKAFALRIDERTLAAMQRWANDDLRSLNAQIEFILRESLRKAGRLPKGEPDADQ